LLGVGLTALLASFMSGMVDNVTAFNTVFTYDFYQTYLVENRPDAHYLRVGRLVTVGGTLLGAISAYNVLSFDNLMDYMQLIGIVFISPYFIVFLLGMFWKRASAAAGFHGMVAGTVGCFTEYLLCRLNVLHFRTPMASNVWNAVWGLVAGLIVMVAVTYFTDPPPPESLKGLTYAHAAPLESVRSLVPDTGILRNRRDRGPNCPALNLRFFCGVMIP
jgi:SSS family solute:Na+ symporter